MAKYVLAADYTLMTDYRNVPLATFFSCIPTDYWQSRLVFRILADQPKLDAQPPSSGRSGAMMSSSPTLGTLTATSMTRQRSSDCIRWIRSAWVP